MGKSVLTHSPTKRPLTFPFLHVSPPQKLGLAKFFLLSQSESTEIENFSKNQIFKFFSLSLCSLFPYTAKDPRHSSN